MARDVRGGLSSRPDERQPLVLGLRLFGYGRDPIRQGNPWLLAPRPDMSSRKESNRVIERAAAQGSEVGAPVAGCVDARLASCASPDRRPASAGLLVETEVQVALGGEILQCKEHVLAERAPGPFLAIGAMTGVGTGSEAVPQAVPNRTTQASASQDPLHLALSPVCREHLASARCPRKAGAGPDGFPQVSGRCPLPGMRTCGFFDLHRRRPVAGCRRRDIAPCGTGPLPQAGRAHPEDRSLISFIQFECRRRLIGNLVLKWGCHHAETKDCQQGKRPCPARKDSVVCTAFHSGKRGVFHNVCRNRGTMVRTSAAESDRRALLEGRRVTACFARLRAVAGLPQGSAGDRVRQPGGMCPRRPAAADARALEWADTAVSQEPEARPVDRCPSAGRFRTAAAFPVRPRRGT